MLDRDRDGQVLRGAARYRLHQDEGLVEVRGDEPDALSAEQWSSLAMGNYDDMLTLTHAKWLHRSLVDRAIGGRRLVSREMLMEVGKTG